jgi:hypothetical protein
MKRTALLVFVTALAACGSTWADAATRRVSAETWLAQRQALEQQDAARYRVCDAQRFDNPATHRIDFTAAGRRCLIDALGQSVSVQGKLVLLRNAFATLRKTPEDQTLRMASLRAVEQARIQLAADRVGLRDRFAEEATALDLAEFSIRMPEQYYQQQLWRLEAYWSVGQAPGRE